MSRTNHAKQIDGEIMADPHGWADARLPRALTFRAWRIPASGQAIELDIGGPDTLEDALAEAQLGTGICHKETVLILEQDSGKRRAVQHAFAVKRKSQPIWRKCPDTGVSKPFHPLYLDELFSVEVDAFQPTRPFDAFRDNAAGRDLTLVEQGA